MNLASTLLAVTALAALAAPLTAAAQGKLVMKAADVHPASYPDVVAIENMGKKLSAATNGRITFQMFPGSVLGGEKEMIEQTQVGAIQILRTSLGPIGPVVPEVNVFNMPFVFRDEAHMRAVIDGAIGQHCHSGIGYMTPHSVHNGLAADMRAIRQATLDAAFLANPNRFKNKPPQLPPMLTAAWINPPPEETTPISEPVVRTLNLRLQVSHSH